MRHSSTKGKHITLQEPALAKGQACVTCKLRRVRCNAAKPGCSSCRRSAKFDGRDENEVVCTYPPARKPGTRRRRKAVVEVKTEPSPTPEPTEVDAGLPFALPELRPTEVDAGLPFALPELPPLDGQFEHYPTAALLLMNHNHLSRTETNSSDWSDFSARSSGEPTSSSPSTAHTSPSPTPLKPFDPVDTLDSTFSTLAFPFAPLPAPSALPFAPLPSLDSSSYFDALNFARSTNTTTSYPTTTNDPSAPLSTQYPSFNPFSYFALPPPAPSAAPGYFDLPPPPLGQQQGWMAGTPTTALDFNWSMGAMSGVPFTPGVVDWEALGMATA